MLEKDLEKYRVAFDEVKRKYTECSVRREAEKDNASSALLDSQRSLDDWEAALTTLLSHYNELLARARLMKGFGKVDALPEVVMRMTAATQRDSAVLPHALNAGEVNTPTERLSAKRKRREGVRD